MEKIALSEELWNHVHLFENKEFWDRYLPYEKVEQTLLELPSLFQVEQIGKSVGGKSIWSVRCGKGKIKVLMWSQMHGNETTTTKAVLDIFRAFSKAGEFSFFRKIIENCTLTIVPVLNPDGAIAYSRENRNQVDLNRDAVDLSQPESQILQNIFENFEPDFCFNLHDQRSIYGVGTTAKPAIVSFLAPSMDKEKSLTEPRKTAMKLIAEMNASLQRHIPGNLGRYDDSFNPNCVGDKFQSLNVPTILLEAGHFPIDRNRNKTRNFIFLALFTALDSIVSKSFEKQNFRDYFHIPENKKSFFDIILRNLSINGKTADLAIQFEERLRGQKIEFVPIVEKIGDLSMYFGHENSTFYREKLRINRSTTVKEKIEIKHIAIGNNLILKKLTNN